MKGSENRIAKAAGIILAWAVILFTTAAAVYAMAGDGSMLSREMLRHAPPETTGLPEAEYEGVCRMTAAYLTGREKAFQYVFSDAEGRRYACFQDHEADHMEDCRSLIRLAGSLRWIAGGAALLLISAGILLRKEKRAFAKGMLLGLAAAGVIASAAVLWAVIDFDGFFTAFHRIAFTNEGWLLNPRTDLLIRLMPTNFFIALGAKLTLRIIAATGITGLIAWIISKQRGLIRNS